MDHDKDKWLNHPNYPLVLENLKKFCKSDWKTKHFGMNFKIGERTCRFIKTRELFGICEKRVSYSVLEVKDPTFDFTDDEKVMKTWEDDTFGRKVDNIGFERFKYGFTSKEVRTKVGRERVARFLVFTVFDD
jgi:hypothetical protein